VSPPADWEAINRLFDAVVDLDPDARRQALEDWTGDPKVRAEVESLLAALGSQVVDLEPSPGASHLTLGGEAAVITVSLTGRRLGPWAVVREVGRGGMGAVYEAFRADDQYKKRVAVKTLSRGADSAVVARRFQQERQILASLGHPSIATLIDGGVTEEGLPYLVMEFVDGEPIDRYCAGHRLPLRERLDLFRQVCAAVQYAHRNLVVHRDIKPSNVLVTADGVVKLVDFGIAKLIGHRPGEEPTLTETGLRAFTMAYASPEQIRGEPISTSSDVYSLGALLYLLVAGRLPFDVGRVGTAEAVRMVTEETATAPSRACTGEAAETMGLAGQDRLARELDGELDDIVLACLRKEPERRYATVAAVSDDIKRFLQGQQVSARPDTWRYRVSSFTRRNPRLVVAMLVAAVSLTGGAAVAGWQAVRADDERDRARTEAVRSSRVVAFIEQTLATPVQGALSETAIQALDQAVSRARGELADDPLARAAVYRTAAKAYTSHVRDERATPLLDSALALDRRFAGEESIEVARDLTILARISYNRGLMDSAVVYARKAVEILRAKPSDRPDDLPMALLYYSFALTYAGRPAEALPIAREGIAVEAARAPSALLAYLYMAVGEAELFQGDAEKGELEYQRSIQLYDSLPGTQPVERGIAELGLSSSLLNRGAADEAAVHGRKAIDIFTRHWGPEHAYTGRAHALMARVAVARGDSAAARTEIATVFRALEQSRLGLVDRITIEFELGRVLLAAGRNEEAVDRLSAALRARQAELLRTPQILGFGLILLGDALFRLRRATEAQAAYVESYRIRSMTYPNDHPYLTITAGRILFTSAALGDSATFARHAAKFPADTVAAIKGRAQAWSRQGARPTDDGASR
jgi:eukaryotic-like serine/threonine-protein kinase